MSERSSETLLITAARGKQATALIPLVLPLFRKCRLQVLTQASRDRLAIQYPTAEVVCADLDSKQACKDLMSGVRCAYIIGPTFHPNETGIVKNLIDAAVHETSHGTFKHFVYSSVLHPQISDLKNHDVKRLAVEYLHNQAPELKYTIVQPCHFADNLPVGMLLSQLLEPAEPAEPTQVSGDEKADNETKNGVKEITFIPNSNPRIPFSFSTVSDTARAAARILVQRERHFFATYELVSIPGPLSYEVAIALVQEVINRLLAEAGRAVGVTGNAASTFSAGKSSTHRLPRSCRIVIKEQSTHETVQRMQRLFGTPDAGNEANDSDGGNDRTGRKDGKVGIDPATSERLITYYNRRGLYGNSNVLKWILGIGVPGGRGSDGREQSITKSREDSVTADSSQFGTHIQTSTIEASEGIFETYEAWARWKVSAVWAEMGFPT